VTIMNESTQDRELPATGLWKEVPEEIRRRLTAAGEFKSLTAGKYIAVQGKEFTSLVVVLAGKLRVTCHGHGDTVVLAELGPGDTVGEMSLIDPRPASANVRVEEGGAEIWEIADAHFEHFVEGDSVAGYAVMKMLARELCRRLRKDADHMLHREDQIRTRFRDMDY